LGGVLYLSSISSLTEYAYSDHVMTLIVCLPGIYSFYLWLLVQFEIKIITNRRIKIRKSIWNSGMRPTHLFRVKDQDYDLPWYWKPYGLGTVVFETSDSSDHFIHIRAIKNAKELHDRIERLVVSERKKHGVQEIDYR